MTTLQVSLSKSVDTNYPVALDNQWSSSKKGRMFEYYITKMIYA